MKTKLIIELESPDTVNIFPEEGLGEEDFKGEEKQKELKKFRDEYVKDLHEELVNKARKYFDNELFEENFLDELEELFIEGNESFDNYEIKIKTCLEEEV